MRCLSCNVELTDFEATRKSATTNEYIDLCNSCFRTVKDDIIVLERYDLYSNDEDDTDNVDYEDNNEII